MPRGLKPTINQEAGRMARRAAKVIRKTGWTKRRWGSPGQPMCIGGAMAVAESGQTLKSNTSLGSKIIRDEPCQVLAKWLYENHPKSAAWIEGLKREGVVVGSGIFFSIPSWNDQYPETQEEVLQWLDKAAAELDPRGGK